MAEVQILRLCTLGGQKPGMKKGPHHFFVCRSQLCQIPFGRDQVQILRLGIVRFQYFATGSTDFLHCLSGVLEHHRLKRIRDLLARRVENSPHRNEPNLSLYRSKDNRLLIEQWPSPTRREIPYHSPNTHGYIARAFCPNLSRGL